MTFERGIVPILAISHSVGLHGLMWGFVMFPEDSNNLETDLDAEGDDDQAEFHAASEQSTHPAVQPRWPTRVS